MSNTEIYETSEMPLAATLLSYGFPLESIDNSNPRKAIFGIAEFNHDMTPVDTVIDLYWSKRAVIEPAAFYANLRFLKSRILANASDRKGQ